MVELLGFFPEREKKRIDFKETAENGCQRIDH